MTDKTIDTLDAFSGTLSATSKFVVADGDDVLKRASGTQMKAYLGGGDVAGDTHAATAKSAPADADEIPIVDSAASWVLKKLTWSNIKSTLATYFDTIYLKLTGGTIAGGTRTTSGSTLTITETRNAAGVTFPGALLVDVTDTASAAYSRLADFKSGGVSKFAIDKSGLIRPTGMDISNGLSIDNSGTRIFYGNGESRIQFGGAGGSAWEFFSRLSGAAIAAKTITDNPATILTAVRGAASQSADLSQWRNSTEGILTTISSTGDFFRYNSYIDPSNYERGFMRWASNVLEIGTEAAGTGLSRAVSISAGMNNLSLIGGVLYIGDNYTDVAIINSHGYRVRLYYSQFVPETPGLVDLKNTDGNFGWGYLLAGHKTLTNTSGFTAMAEIRPTYNQTSGTAANTDILVNRTETAVGSGAQLLMDLQVGGVSKFKVDKLGNAFPAGGVHTSGDVNFYSTAGIKWSAGTDIYGNDASDTLSQRRGTRAQTNRLYGTYTDASNGRWLEKSMTTAGVAVIKPTGNGTGASGNVLHISGLPTSNPGPGILWNNAGTPAIGT